MVEKGYPFPLYSLDVLGAGQAPLDEERYALPAAAGRLVIAPALRRRGEEVGTAACEELAALGLSRQRLGAAPLSALGFDGDWAAGLRYWRRRMVEQQRLCGAIDAEIDEAAAQRRRRIEEATLLWGPPLPLGRPARCGPALGHRAQAEALRAAAEADRAEAEHRRRQEEAQARLAVIRGALLGDLAMLFRAPSAVLLPRPLQLPQGRVTLSR